MDKATVDSLATRAEGFVASGALPSRRASIPTSNGAAAAVGKAAERLAMMDAKLQVGQYCCSFRLKCFEGRTDGICRSTVDENQLFT